MAFEFLQCKRLRLEEVNGSTYPPDISTTTIGENDIVVGSGTTPPLKPGGAKITYNSPVLNIDMDPAYANTSTLFFNSDTHTLGLHVEGDNNIALENNSGVPRDLTIANNSNGPVTVTCPNGELIVSPTSIRMKYTGVQDSSVELTEDGLKLEINGDDGATAGSVLTSDGNGTCVWVAPGAWEIGQSRYFEKQIDAASITNSYATSFVIWDISLYQPGAYKLRGMRVSAGAGYVGAGRVTSITDNGVRFFSTSTAVVWNNGAQTFWGSGCLGFAPGVNTFSVIQDKIKIMYTGGGGADWTAGDTRIVLEIEKVPPP